MDKNRDLLDSINRENGLTRINRAIYQKLVDCGIPGIIVAKPAYNLAQMYIQSLDFVAKTNEFSKLTDAPSIAEKVLEMRESVKVLRHFTGQFGRSYYVLMDRLSMITGNWYGEGYEEALDEAVNKFEEILSNLASEDLRDRMQDEIRSHNRQQHGNIVRRLISKGCPEDISNHFADNLFELKLEAANLISLVDKMVSLTDDFENLILEIEQILVDISIPWVGFSPGETAHALWHMGDHDEDNFFFMGFLGWSLAVLENLQENVEDL
ncbi:MAG: hypothetical protein QME63_05520 [Actinomycetota bacterium]|nr:hypothetical protein [Actinomycetota bacterium]